MRANVFLLSDNWTADFYANNFTNIIKNKEEEKKGETALRRQTLLRFYATFTRENIHRQREKRLWSRLNRDSSPLPSPWKKIKIRPRTETKRRN